MNSSALLDDETGKTLAIFEFHVPLVSSDAGDRNEFFGYPASGLLFRWFYSTILDRDVEWLAVGASLTDSMQD